MPLGEWHGDSCPPIKLLIKFKLSLIKGSKLSIETSISFPCDSPKIENLSPLFQIDDTKTTTF